MELVVKEGGSLVVDGGELTVGKLVVDDGGSCDIVNGGTLTVRTATPLKQKGKKEGSYYLYNIKTRKGQTITLNAK